MLLWVIIKTTDNGAKCLLTGLAIILRNQDRWEHQKLQINLFSNEGPHCVRARPHLLSHGAAPHVQFVLEPYLARFCFVFLLTDETRHKKQIMVCLCADK